MSVRLRQWKDKKTGKQDEAWVVDVHFQHADGRIERVRKASPVNTRRGAEQYERDLRLALANGRYRKDVIKQFAPTLAKFEARYMEHAELHNKPGTVQEKRSVLRTHLAPMFGKHRLDSIGIEEVDSLKLKLKKAGTSIKTINNVVGVLHNILVRAAECKLIPAPERLQYLKRTSAEPEEDFLSFEEADQLVSASSPIWRPLVIVALNTGLRRGELRALQWSDVQIDPGRIVVRRAVYRGQFGTPKGGRTREIPLNQTAKTSLRQQRHLRGPFVFCNEDGSYLKSDTCRKVIDNAAKAAGLRAIGWHTLRHTFASHLVMSGVPLAAVQKLLGHASIKTTMRYAHLSPSITMDAVNVLDARTAHRRHMSEEK
jgi:integrase